MYRQLIFLGFLVCGFGSVLAQNNPSNPEMAQALLNLEKLVTAQHPVSAAKVSEKRKPSQQDPNAKAATAQIRLTDAQHTKNAFLFVVHESTKKMITPTPVKNQKMSEEKVSALKAALRIDQ